MKKAELGLWVLRRPQWHLKVVSVTCQGALGKGPQLCPWVRVLQSGGVSCCYSRPREVQRGTVTDEDVGVEPAGTDSHLQKSFMLRDHGSLRRL